MIANEQPDLPDISKIGCGLFFLSAILVIAVAIVIVGMLQLAGII